MSVNIFGERYMSSRQPAWGEIGESVAGVSAKEAVDKTDLNYEVMKLPLYVNVGGKKVEVDGKKLVARVISEEDSYIVPFGVVSDDYGVIQNSQIAEMLDLVAKEWPIDTVGSLSYGKRAFFSLKSEDFDVNDDPVNGYFLLVDDKTGTFSLKMAFTPVRVLCQNTLITGLAAATATVRIQHTSQVVADAELRMKMLAAMSRSKQSLVNQFKYMGETKISEKNAADVIEAAYPMPSVPSKMIDLSILDEEVLMEYDEAARDEIKHVRETWEYYCDRTQVFRDGAMEMFQKFNDENPKVAMTLWSVYNAVVETEDYREGGYSVPESTLFGLRANAKKRAFRAAVEFG